MRLFAHKTKETGCWRLERLAAFSDGVIAIIITLLVLGIEVPSVHQVTKRELGDYLLASIYPICGYVLSFFLIGMYWMQHYAISHFLTHVNRPFIILNIIFLLFLSFLPFPTGLHAVYRADELAVVVYGVAQIFCGLSLLALWLYATRNHRLVSDSIPPEVVSSMSRRLAFAPVLCLVAIAVSYMNPWVSRLVFVAIPCCYVSHRIVDQGWMEMQTETVAAKTTEPESV